MAGIVDCERHVLVSDLEELTPYLEPAWVQRLTGSEFRLPPQSPHPGLEVEASVVAADYDAGALPEGTEAALLVPAQPLVTSGWLSHEMAQVFCSAVNDYLVARHQPDGRRLRFAIAVQSHDAELAAAEIRRLGEHPAAAAVSLSLIRVNMGQGHYHPIYEAACELGLTVIVHPGGFEGAVQGPAELGGVGPYTAEEAFSLVPQVGATNVTSMLYDGTFERFPELRVAFAGFGFAWVVPLLWRADTEWRNLRVEVPWMTRPPSGYVADHVRFILDGSAELPGAVGWKTVADVPESTLVYGSDAPFELGLDPDVLAGAPSELRERIAAVNARETFGFATPVEAS